MTDALYDPSPDTFARVSTEQHYQHARRLERDRARLMEILDGITARHEGYGGGFGPCLCEWHEKSRALLKELTC